jgi:hypothetical protein
MTEPLSDRFKLITVFLFTASIIILFQVYLASFVFRQSDIFWNTGSSKLFDSGRILAPIRPIFTQRADAYRLSPPTLPYVSGGLPPMDR